MVKSSLKSIISGSFWGVVAKILDALAKFVTIPMLVGYYGKLDYGLIALTFSLNAYLRLMDLGMNVGSIRFFSMWLLDKEWEKIGKVSRSSIIFYGVIGIVNAFIFFVMAQFGESLFNISPDQIIVYKNMMYILAISTIVNWLSNVLIQLLSAANEFTWINQVTIVSSAFNFITAFLAIHFGLTLVNYFFLYTVSTILIVPFNIYKLNVYNLPRSFFLLPKWDGQAFKEVLAYSSAIFVMGIFQVTANNLRPLLLGKFASSGVEVLTEYRVMQTIVMLILAFGGVIMQVLLPSTSKIYAEQDLDKLNRVVYTGTKYISVFFSFIVFILVANSQNILLLYMGNEYSALKIWLDVWLLTVLVSMHNAPVASLVLSTGKTKFLVYSSAISCLVSLPVTTILAPSLNVGAAVLGYFVYIVLQISFYYLYYIPKVLKLDSSKIFFGSFLPAAFVGFSSYIIVYVFDSIHLIESTILNIITNSFIYLSVFATLILLFIIKPSEIRNFKNSLFRK